MSSNRFGHGIGTGVIGRRRPTFPGQPGACRACGRVLLNKHLCPLWVITGSLGQVMRTSAPRCKADEIGGKADIGPRTSAFGVRADSLAYPMECLLVAKRRHKLGPRKATIGCTENPLESSILRARQTAAHCLAVSIYRNQLPQSKAEQITNQGSFSTASSGFAPLTHRAGDTAHAGNSKTL